MNTTKTATNGVTEAAGAAPATFEAIRSARAFEEIAQQIRDELASGRLEVGSRLPSERALAEQFGVSRNTLREALRALEHGGLIRLQKGATGGAFVSERSGKGVVTGLMDMYRLGAIAPAQLTQARIWLEAIIVREACLRATPADIEELQRNVAVAAEASRRGDFPLRAATHQDFHRVLARMTGNPVMVTVMNGLLEVLAEFIDQIGSQANAFVLPSRRRFMKHFAVGDAAAAVAEMEASLKRLQRNYLSQMERNAADAAMAAAAPRGPRAAVQDAEALRPVRRARTSAPSRRPQPA